MSDLDRPFRPFEVPSFGKFDFEAEVGPASKLGEHMTIQEWEAEFRNHGKCRANVGTFSRHYVQGHMSY